MDVHDAMCIWARAVDRRMDNQPGTIYSARSACDAVETDGDEILEHLRERGYDGGPVESRYGAEGAGPSIYVNDPEGNVVELKGAPWGTSDE